MQAQVAEDSGAGSVAAAAATAAASCSYAAAACIAVQGAPNTPLSAQSQAPKCKYAIDYIDASV